jgi:hypothetical protein
VGLHCGTKSQPWLLEAPAGQRINVSLFDFSVTDAVSTTDNQSQDALRASHFTSSSNNNGQRSCAHQRQFGYIVDKSAVIKNVTVCSSREDQRIRNIYVSTSNVVELVLAPRDGNSGTFNVLLSIEGEMAFVLR